ncbi:MAG: maleylpyruvate isomerase N-terminal domain-containing protein [Sporichthyaceae bacterium]
MAAAGGAKQEILDALGSAGARFAGLVRSLDPVEASRPVAGVEWDAAGTAAHVLTVAGRLLGDRRRGVDPADVQRLNQVCLDEMADRDPASLAERLERDLGVVAERVYPKVDFDRQYPFHGSVTISGGGGAAFFLCELLVHGYDIAAAAGKDWEISAAEAACAVRGPAEFWSSIVEPDGILTVDLGDFGPVAIPIPSETRVAAGSLSADPVELLLAEFGRAAPSDVSLAAVLAALPQM